eukprot:TRINITY_DN103019_c0_g1_i1.p2 TRINITY_DN103019_c0_g1~~TRINITY_DN103019_c0_g1_i1.p2  ORF type:complete len:104 (-),score=1.58 TRINITY_DN103019_c0_g1_i1:69-380(-)
MFRRSFSVICSSSSSNLAAHKFISFSSITHNCCCTCLCSFASNFFSLASLLHAAVSCLPPPISSTPVVPLPSVAKDCNPALLADVQDDSYRSVCHASYRNAVM